MNPRADHSRTSSHPSWGTLLFLLLASLLLRYAALTGNHLHVDEPRWMVRGSFLINNLLEGDFEALQSGHWTGRITPEMSKLSARLATGSVTALLTGAGVHLERKLPELSAHDAPFRKISWARGLHALLSSLTPLLLFLLLRQCIPETGALLAAAFVMFEPVIQYWAAMAHLEAVLTLAVPVSLLLYDQARRQGSTLLVVLSGAVFGLAFANRANAAVIPIALVLYTAIRIWSSRSEGKSGTRIREEGFRLLLFGLAGWVVFVVFYPPIWTSPVTGFLSFIKVYADSSGALASNRLTLVRWLGYHSAPAWLFLLVSLAGLLSRPVRSHRIFQLGAVCYVVSFLVLLMPPAFHSRYLSSVMPALALMGSVSIAVFLKRFLGDSERTRRTVWWCFAGLSLVLCLFTLMGAWRSERSIRETYRELQDLDFAEVHVPGRSARYVRLEAGEGRPRLFVTSRGSTPVLPALYLGVSVTDHGKYDEVGPGWTKIRPSEVVHCEAGDWVFGESRPRGHAGQRAVGYRRLYFWPCLP